MALSTAVMVGDAQEWLPEIKEKAAALVVNAGHEPDADLGPLISPESKQRVEHLIQSAVDEGADVRIRPLHTLGQKSTFYPEITKNLMFEKCELCEK